MSPTDKRRLIVGGSVIGAVLLMVGLSNLASDHDDRSVASTVTKTVTMTARPTTVTETALPVTVTQTVAQAAPEAPALEAPAPIAEPPVEVPPSEPLPQIAPLAPQLPSTVYYAKCADARAAGAAPLYAGQPGYRSGLDSDGDGVACE